MDLTLIFIVATAFFSLIVGLASLPKQEHPIRARALAAVLVLASGASVYTGIRGSADGERQAAAMTSQGRALHEARRSLADIKAEMLDTRIACEDSEKVAAACAGAYQQGRPYSQFYAELPADERRGYPVPDCGPLPAWRAGGAQVRVSSWPTPSKAEESLKLIKRLLSDDGQSEWASHVMSTPVESHAFNDPNRKLWVGAILFVEAAHTERICTWLECKGVQAGFEACGARNVYGAPSGAL